MQILSWSNMEQQINFGCHVIIDILWQMPQHFSKSLYGEVNRHSFSEILSSPLTIILWRWCSFHFVVLSFTENIVEHHRVPLFLQSDNQDMNFFPCVFISFIRVRKNFMNRKDKSNLFIFWSQRKINSFSLMNNLLRML